MLMSKKAVIIGGGPAGLTAAYELLAHSDIKPVVFETSTQLGGISRTINYKGNRMDIGGHRFFSKSQRVMDWWLKLLPQGDAEKEDEVFLLRQRLSRIAFLGRFFDYPVSLSVGTLWNLGFWRTTKLGCSYLWTALTPKREEKSLEDFFINRFGYELYATFFRDYTEKVWGVPCSDISPEWGAQRIKGLSIISALWHAIKKLITPKGDLAQKSTETSLIERFLYPKFGPGQLWEKVGREIVHGGGSIELEHQVVGVKRVGNRITGVEVLNKQSGEKSFVEADYFFSSMPIPTLVNYLGDHPSDEVREVAAGLQFRDFITVGVLFSKLRSEMLPDTWIYVQEPSLKMGRIQVFNNWSPYLVKDENNIWLGLEYFATEGDELWSMEDKDIGELAVDELVKMNLVNKGDLLDSVVVRSPKTYPCYFGTYERFPLIQDYFETFENLFLVGRNGMHRYNNADHSMLTAFEAVDNIKSGKKSKENIWSVNAEQDYHEEKQTS